MRKAIEAASRSGLFSTQMLEILYSHNIPCGYQVYYDQVEFKEYIDYCVESAIPVLVGIHVDEEMEKVVEGENREGDVCGNKVGRHCVRV